MPRYLIERNVPGAGQLSEAELQGIAATSNNVLKDMAPRAQWLRTFVTDDKLFCEYFAEDPEALREHGRCGGFPVTNIFRVSGFIDPVTADA